MGNRLQQDRQCHLETILDILIVNHSRRILVHLHNYLHLEERRYDHQPKASGSHNLQLMQLMLFSFQNLHFRGDRKYVASSPKAISIQALSAFQSSHLKYSNQKYFPLNILLKHEYLEPDFSRYEGPIEEPIQLMPLPALIIQILYS